MERSTTRKRGCAEFSWFILISIIHPASLLENCSAAQFCELNSQVSWYVYSYFGVAHRFMRNFPRPLRVDFYRVHTRMSVNKIQPGQSNYPLWYKYTMNEVRVLLADDHAIVRTGIRKTIEELPNLVVIDEVGNGPRVFTVLARERIDCLLIDVTMPDFEPISAIRQIRSLYPALKILVVSAYDDDIYVQGLLGAGVNGYHMKDQPLNDLKLAVQRVLDGERWISSSLISKLVGQPGYVPSTPQLTMRQRNLLKLLHQGLDNKSIAQETGSECKNRGEPPDTHL